MEEEMREKNLWHRASYVFVQNCKDEFLVQLTSMNNSFWPGALSFASGGPMKLSETSEENAQAELFRQLGIRREQSELTLIGQEYYTDEKKRVYGNIYYTKLEDEGKDLDILQSAIEGVMYMSKHKLVQYVEEQKLAEKAGKEVLAVTPDSVKMFEFFLKAFYKGHTDLMILDTSL